MESGTMFCLGLTNDACSRLIQNGARLAGLLTQFSRLGFMGTLIAASLIILGTIVDQMLRVLRMP